jgi:dihydroorotase (multifunctional complex type)
LRYDLIIKNGILVTALKTVEENIAVSNGAIMRIGDLHRSDTANEIYDADGKYILPGIIDAHVHFRDPGLTEKEDFETGSIAAAFGGVTTVVDMPNVIPVTSTLERFKEKLKIARKKSYVDFGLFALLTNDNLGELDNLKKAGAFGFKVFFGTSTGEIAAPSAPILIQQMEKIRKLDMRIGFHCETSELNSYFTSLCKNKTNLNNGILLSQARPVISETLAIQTVILYAEYTRAKVHIHHVTSAEGALLAAEAKQKKLKISAETCPHYLLFDETQNTCKVYPPIRGIDHRKALWEALKKEKIDFIASDHAPHTAAEKALPLWDAPAGLCGVETSVPLMLNEVNKGKLSLNDYVRIASEAPAKVWDIYPKKGSLRESADADFTVVDMNMKKVITADGLHSKSKTTPYEGMEVQGCPVATIVRGKFVMRDGELTGVKGHGIQVKPII